MQMTLLPHGQWEFRFWPRLSCDHVQLVFSFVHVIVTYEEITFVQWGDFERDPRFFQIYFIFYLKLHFFFMIL